MKARNTNAAGVEYAAMAVANSALRAVPGGLAQRADLLGNISDSDSSPATRQRSDASNATSDDDDRSIESFDDKKNSGSGGHSSEDYTDDEDEGEEGYKPGGYHPVKLGEVYNQRYVDKKVKSRDQNIHYLEASTFFLTISSFHSLLLIKDMLSLRN
jgi:hypothetical protein